MAPDSTGESLSSLELGLRDSLDPDPDPIDGDIHSNGGLKDAAGKAAGTAQLQTIPDKGLKLEEWTTQ